MKNINVLSLFDGISCARVALDRLGYYPTYYASEIDKYAIQIAKKNYPDTIQIGDVKNIRINMFDKAIDLLIGGSPCQDLSIAKSNRQGLDGNKSKLFWEYVRILQEIKPKYFVFENVYSMSMNARLTISKILGVNPIMIDAALVSAQRRKRLFWTNIPNITIPKDEKMSLNDIIDMSICTTEKDNWKRWFLSESGQKRMNHGHIAINPEKALTLLARTYANWCGTYVNYGYGIRKLTPIECERLQSLPDNYTFGISNRQRYKCLGNAFNVNVIKHILSFMDQY